MTEKSIQKRGFSVQQLTLAGVMAAVICIMGPFSVPIGLVPIALSNLAIYIASYILGTKKATISCIIYLLAGFIGIPVFSGFTSGAGKLLGPTGGYLIGYIFMALIGGFFCEKYNDKKIVCFLGMVLGTIVTYAIGTAWLAYEASMTVKAALMAGVIPFIPGDLIKMIAALIIGIQVKKQLVRGGLL